MYVTQLMAPLFWPQQMRVSGNNKRIFLHNHEENSNFLSHLLVGTIFYSLHKVTKKYKPKNRGIKYKRLFYTDQLI